MDKKPYKTQKDSYRPFWEDEKYNDNFSHIPFQVLMENFLIDIFPAYRVYVYKPEITEINDSLRLKYRAELLHSSTSQSIEKFFQFLVPAITGRGTFIIDDIERVFLLQLVSSAGIFFGDNSVSIRPAMGYWIDFDLSPSRNYPYGTVRLKKHYKIPVPVFLKLIGFTAKDFKETGMTEIEISKPVNRQISELTGIDDEKKWPAIFKKDFLNHIDMGRTGIWQLSRKLDIKKKDTFLTKTDIKNMLQIIKENNYRDDLDCLSNRVVMQIGDHLERTIDSILTALKKSIIKEHKNDQAGVLFDYIRRVLPGRTVEAVKTLFKSSSLSQIIPSTNILSDVTFTRRITKFGPGGISKQTAEDYKVRDLHSSYYGRICPVDTPQGENVGVVLSLTENTRINGLGILEAPYYKVKYRNKRFYINEEPVWMTPDQEKKYFIAYGDRIISKDQEIVQVRKDGKELLEVEINKVEYIDSCPEHACGLTARLIPFLSNNDPSRMMISCALMQQFLPLKKRELPLIYTGYEKIIAEESGQLYRKGDRGKYSGPQASHLNVLKGSIELKKEKEASEGDIIAAPPSTLDGELAGGVNLLVAYLPWKGYNYEDAIVISDELVKEELLTSLHSDGLEKPVEVGDKLANRHGGKGVVSLILPKEKMPYFFDKDGNKRHIQVILNPLGVISRMNLGQIFETHLGLIARENKTRYMVPVFGNTITERSEELPLSSEIPESYRLFSQIKHKLEELRKTFKGIDENGKITLYDPELGEIKNSVLAGYQYIMKLNQLARDKFNFRKDGPYSYITEQPVKGRKFHGGQKAGEMEGWALQSYMAFENLREFFTLKSDDIASRTKDIRGVPESLKTFIYYLRGMCLDLNFFAKDGKNITEELLYDEISPDEIDTIKLDIAGEDIVKEWCCGRQITLSTLREERTETLADMDGTIYSKEFFGEWRKNKKINLDIWLVVTDSILNKVKRKISKDKREFLKTLKNRAFTREELIKKLLKKNFSNKEIEIITGEARVNISNRPLKNEIFGECLKKLDIQENNIADGVVKLINNHEKWEALLKILRRYFYEESINDFDVYMRENAFIKTFGNHLGDYLREMTVFFPRALNRLKLDNKKLLRHRMACISLPEAVKHPLFSFKENIKIKLLPVIPFAYRPVISQNGICISHDLNTHYEWILHLMNGIYNKDKFYRVLHRLFINKKIKVKINEKEEIQIYPLKIDGIPASSFMKLLEGKDGFIRKYMLGKRVNYSGRGVIVVDPSLEIDQVRIASKDVLKSIMELEEPYGLDETDYETMRKKIENRPLLLNRQPSLHRLSIQAFKNIPLPENSEYVIYINPLVTGGFGADFDGDTMAFHIPLSREAVKETEKMLPSHNILSPASDRIHFSLGQDIKLGLTAGRYNSELIEELSPGKTEISEKDLQNFILEIDKNNKDIDIISTISKKLSLILKLIYEQSTLSGTTFSIFDLPLRSGNSEKELELYEQGKKNEDEIDFFKDNNTLFSIYPAKARGSKDNLIQMCYKKGKVSGIRDRKDGDREINSCYMEGLTAGEYYYANYGARQGIVCKKLGTGKGGDLTRHLIEAVYDITITAEDCKTKEGIKLTPYMIENGICLTGRYMTGDSKPLDEEKIKDILKNGKDITLRSPLTCAQKDGICSLCYGNFTGKLPEQGLPVGIIAAQTIGERGTQLQLKIIHLAGQTDIKQAIGQDLDGAVKLFKLNPEKLLETESFVNKEELYGKLMSFARSVYSKSDILDRHFEVIFRYMLQKYPDKKIRKLKEIIEDGDFLNKITFSSTLKLLAEAILNKHNIIKLGGLKKRLLFTSF